jgi:hypothetical protein
MPTISTTARRLRAYQATLDRLARPARPTTASRRCAPAGDGTLHALLTVSAYFTLAYITPCPLHVRKKTFWGFWVKAGITRQTHPSNTPLKSQCRHGAGSRPRLAHRYPAHSKARAGPKIFNFVLGQASHANPGSTTPDHLGSF